MGGAQRGRGEPRVHRIVSPVNGTVVSRNVTMGQTVAASFQTPTLFLIATDLTKMEVDANVSESDIGAIHTGDTTSFTVEAFPDHLFTGDVLQVRQAPQSVQNVITYDVVIGVANPDLLLKPGMTATCRIVTARRDQVLRVPDLALRYSPGGWPPRPAASGNDRGEVWLLRQGRGEGAAWRWTDDDSYSEIVNGSSRRETSSSRLNDVRRRRMGRAWRDPICDPATEGLRCATS